MRAHARAGGNAAFVYFPNGKAWDCLPGESSAALADVGDRPTILRRDARRPPLQQRGALGPRVLLLRGQRRGGWQGTPPQAGCSCHAASLLL